MSDLPSPPAHVRISGIRARAGLNTLGFTIEAPPPPPGVSDLLQALTKSARPTVVRRDTGSSTTTDGSVLSEAQSFQSLFHRASSASSASSFATSISGSPIKSLGEYEATASPDNIHLDYDSADFYDADADTESRSPSPRQCNVNEVELSATVTDDKESHSGSDSSSYHSALSVAEYVLSPGRPCRPLSVDEFGVLLFPGARPPFSPDELEQRAALDHKETVRLPAGKVFSFLYRKKPIKTIAAAKYPAFHHTPSGHSARLDYHVGADASYQATQDRRQPPTVTFAVANGRHTNRLPQSPFPFMQSGTHKAELASTWSDESDTGEDFAVSHIDDDGELERQPAAEYASLFDCYSRPTRFHDTSDSTGFYAGSVAPSGAFQFSRGSFARKPSTTVGFDGLVACPRPRRVENIGVPSWCTSSGSVSKIALAELRPKTGLDFRGDIYPWLPVVTAYDRKPRYVDYVESSALAPRVQCTLRDCQCTFFKTSPEEDAIRHLCVLIAGKSFLRVINHGAHEVIQNWERILHAPDTSGELALTLAEKMAVVCEMFTKDNQLFRQCLERSLRGTFLSLARSTTEGMDRPQRRDGDKRKLASARMARYAVVIRHLETRRVMQPM